MLDLYVDDTSPWVLEYPFRGCYFMSISIVVVRFAIIISCGVAIGFIPIMVLRAGDSEPYVGLVGLIVLGVLPMLVVAVASRMSDSRAMLVVAGITAMLWPAVGLVSPTAMWTIAGLVALSSAAAIARINSLSGIVGSSLIVAALLVAPVLGARLVFPEMMALGLGGGDWLYHASIAQMIAAHDSVSLGADGLQFHRYHILSHVLAAGLSESTGVSVPLIYVYWPAIILKAQLIFGLVVASISIEGERASGSLYRFSLAWLLAWFSGAFASESFMLALSMFLITLPLLEEQVMRRVTWNGIAVSLLSALACSMAKVSVGFFIAVALLSVAWRIRQRPAYVTIILLSLGVLGFVTLRYLSPTDTMMVGNDWLALPRSYLQYFGGVAFVSFALPLTLIWLISVDAKLTGDENEWRFRIHDFPGGWRAFAEHGAPSAFLLAVFVTAAIAVFFSVPLGSNYAYFSTVLLFASGVFVPQVARDATTGLTCDSRFLRCATGGVVALVAIVLTVQTVWQTKESLFALYRVFNQNASRGEIVRAMASDWMEKGSLLDHTRAATASTAWSRLMADIMAKDDGELAVHTLPDVRQFWTRLKGTNPYWCLMPHLMIPAEIAVAQIRNVAPKAIQQECANDGLVFYGFGKAQDSHRSVTMSDADLCALAQRDGFDSVYLIKSITDIGRNGMLDCA